MATKKFKWGFIIASIVIPAAAIISGLATKEIRCFFRLNSAEICQNDFTELDLIVQNKKLIALDNVEVKFISKGSVEQRFTDSNGYAKIKIPSREDIEIILSKDGFETVRQILNLANDPNKTRTYQLKELTTQTSSTSVPSSSTSVPSSEASPSPSAANLSSSSSTNSPSSSTMPFSASCTKVRGYDAQEYREDISVGLIPVKPDNRIYISKTAPRTATCRITYNSGNFKASYAIPDNSNLLQVRITFYLDGQKVQSLDVARGEKKTINIDTKKSDNIAVTYEVLALNDADYIYLISEPP